MNQSNIKVLLVLATVAILGGVYMYVFKPNMDDKKAIESEIETLETRYNDLKEKDANRDQYLKDIENNAVAFDEIIAYYPATLDQEISVMFVKGLEKDKGNLQFDVKTVGLGKPNVFYNLGGTTTDSVTGETVASDTGYTCYSAAFPIAYEGSYEGLKDFMDYIMDYKYRMNISTINISYNSTDDIYTGSVNLNAYCVSGGDRVADTITIDMENGVDNIFHGGADAADVVTSEYDADNGDSIATDHDILVALNNANNDSTDGIIISAGESDTYVTSADNAVANVTIEVVEEDGKNMVTYSIGSDSYTFEATDNDLTIYVESSDRVDSADKNGVKVSVQNSTDLPVFVKVEGDDSTAPRFTMGNKTGVVKVY